MAITAIKVAINFRIEMNPDLCKHFEALHKPNAHNEFLNWMILSGLKLYKNKGKDKLHKKSNQNKAELKFQEKEKEMSKNDSSQTESLSKIKNSTQTQGDAASVQSLSEADDFTKEFVSGLSGVPKR